MKTLQKLIHHNLTEEAEKHLEQMEPPRISVILNILLSETRQDILEAAEPRLVEAVTDGDYTIDEPVDSEDEYGILTSDKFELITSLFFKALVMDMKQEGQFEKRMNEIHIDLIEQAAREETENGLAAGKI